MVENVSKYCFLSVQLHHVHDSFLALTTDGINFIMNSQEICNVINQCHDPKEAAQRISDQVRCSYKYAHMQTTQCKTKTNNELNLLTSDVAYSSGLHWVMCFLCWNEHGKCSFMFVCVFCTPYCCHKYSPAHQMCTDVRLKITPNKCSIYSSLCQTCFRKRLNLFKLWNYIFLSCF